jgi:hypothetical protein
VEIIKPKATPMDRSCSNCIGQGDDTTPSIVSKCHEYTKYEYDIKNWESCNGIIPSILLDLSSNFNLIIKRWK